MSPDPPRQVPATLLSAMSAADPFSADVFGLGATLYTAVEGAPPFGTNLTYPLDRYTQLWQTSGTTGPPLRVLDTGGPWVTEEYPMAAVTPDNVPMDATTVDEVSYPIDFKDEFAALWHAE